MMHTRCKISALIAVALSCSVTSSFARDVEKRSEREANTEQRGERKHKRGGPRHKMFLKKFDLDKDGKLSPEERQKARKHMQAKRKLNKEQMQRVKQRLHEQFDTDGDGKISTEEKAAARKLTQQRMKELRTQLIEKYDADGDGELSGKERQLARKKEKQKLLEEFDADKDGKLSKAEKVAVFEHMLEHQPFRLMHDLRDRKKMQPGRRGERKKRGGKREQR